MKFSFSHFLFSFLFFQSVWTKYTFVAIFGSMVVWFIFLPVVAYAGPYINNIFSEYLGIIPRLYGNLQFWLYIILVPLLANIRDFMYK